MQVMQVPVHQTTPKPLTEGTDAVFTACVTPVGLMFKAPACLSLLEAAELADMPGLQLPSSCRNGTCRTCICQLSHGLVSLAMCVEVWCGCQGSCITRLEAGYATHGNMKP